ncbi:hypothetical protein BJY04DRAFT_71734 [Aspergillus karnatakaensis]|uniref:PHD finger protein n=1 Tax=Aspergillus karnatakaensis TaxID=1810916 RepID=UPI003CCDB47A
MLRNSLSGISASAGNADASVEITPLGPASTSPYLPSSLSTPDKHWIYKQWVVSGKPHNFVCTQCRKPDNLIYCGSCCRSYHLSCLSPGDQPLQSDQFHCPGCRTGHFDRSPALDSSISPAVSRTGTPFVQGMGRAFLSPSRLGDPVSAPHSAPWSGQTTGASTPFNDYTSRYEPLPGTFDPSILTRARQFLHAHGTFPDDQEFSPDLLLKLGSMMAELEDHRERAQELISENAHLRQDNANIRAYLDSNLASGRPPAQAGGDLSSIARPSPDTTGKSWDRILMDLI